MRFELGQVVVTRGVNEAISESAQFSRFVHESLKRYILCDWGNLCSEDALMNDKAVEFGDDRIFARYNSDLGDLYIITEYDRSYTTILFPDEY